MPLGDANPGRQKLADLELAEFARDYVALADAGVTKVIVQLARKLHMSPGSIRSRRRTPLGARSSPRQIRPRDALVDRLTARGKRILGKGPQAVIQQQCLLVQRLAVSICPH